MTKLDLYWSKNKEWYTVDDNWEYSLTPEAPKEAIDSFKHYQEQIKEKTKNPKKHII